MPVLEPTSLDLHQYSVRHIGPKAAVNPNTIGAEFTVLNRTDFVARPLPPCNLPNTVDFASGHWTGRLNDAGDGTLIWPNKESSDGVPWRQRFDPTSKLQWLEIWVDEFLEQVICITKVTPDRNQIQVDGYDGIQMLKSAYTRDWIWTGSPRDTFYRGTCVWVPIAADSFLGTNYYSAAEDQWTDTVFTPATDGSSASSLSTSPPTGLVLTASTVGGGTTGWALANANGNVLGPTPSPWSALVDVSSATWANTGPDAYHTPSLTFEVWGVGFLDVSASYSITIQQPATAGSGVPTLTFEGASSGVLDGGGSSFTVTASVAASSSYQLLIESDGEWVSAFCNGQMIGQCRSLPVGNCYGGGVYVEMFITGPSGSATSTVSGILFESLEPFLMAGSDQGDYVLPGGSSSDSPPFSSAYTPGGLHARYYNDSDISGDGVRIYKIFAPSRSQAYSGSGAAAEYKNQQDAQINGQQAALGAPGSGPYQNWSCKWFGAIYLPLATHPGSYGFGMTYPANSAVRVWIGQTQFGTQILDEWTSFTTGAGVYSFTLNSTTLQGTLPYGQGNVARDGWYPIVVEYAVDSTTENAPVFSMTPPATYTDPGGTSLTGGTSQTVPATSLSPLGCDDNRYQGTSHYDLTQKTAVAFGYQYALEPYQLESGLFPGVVAPRASRSTLLSNGSTLVTGEGTNYDTVIEPDDSQRKDGMINYSSITDGTDECSSLQGNGAGFQNGNTGQLQANVYYPAKLQTALFDIQAWQDVADAAFAATLANVLGSQLVLRQSPWVSVSGDPAARERRAFTWPLTGAVQNLRWRPGDGIRVTARDINIQDTVPRQLLLVTRNIAPNGATSTTINFAARPKATLYSQRQVLSAALRPLRNYQKQLVTLSGTLASGSIAGDGGTPGSIRGTPSPVALLAGDQLVRAYVRIGSIAGTSPQFGLSVWNGSSYIDETSALNGPWSISPIQLNLLSIARSCAGQGLLQVAVNNYTGNAISAYTCQVFVDVLR